jgi:hypothetical protein
VHLTSQRPEGEKTEMESDLVLHRSLTAADGSPGINIFVKRGRDSPSGQLAVLPPRDLPSSPPRHLDPQRSRKTSSSRTVTPPRSDHGMHHHAQAAEPVAAPAAAAPPSTSPDRPSTPPPSSVQPLELEEGGANTVGSPDVLTPQSVDVGLVERTSARARAISMSRTPRSDSDGAAASRQPVILNQRTEQGRKFRPQLGNGADPSRRGCQRGLRAEPLCSVDRQRERPSSLHIRRPRPHGHNTGCASDGNVCTGCCVCTTKCPTQQCCHAADVPSTGRCMQVPCRSLRLRVWTWTPAAKGASAPAIL